MIRRNLRKKAIGLPGRHDYKTRDKSAKDSLKKHKQLMDYFIEQGMDKGEASKKAFSVVIGKDQLPEGFTYKERIDSAEDEMGIEESKKQADSGAVSLTPSTKKTDFRTDYKPKSKYRTKWEKDKFKHPEKLSYNQLKKAFTEEDIKTPYQLSDDVSHMKGKGYIEMPGRGNGGGLGIGGTNHCVCPECGYKETHDEKGIPCSEYTFCPVCKRDRGNIVHLVGKDMPHGKGKGASKKIAEEDKYHYECGDCGNIFLEEPKLIEQITCPKCGSGRITAASKKTSQFVDFEEAPEGVSRIRPNTDEWKSIVNDFVKGYIKDYPEKDIDISQVMEEVAEYETSEQVNFGNDIDDVVDEIVDSLKKQGFKFGSSKKTSGIYEVWKTKKDQPKEDDVLITVVDTTAQAENIIHKMHKKEEDTDVRYYINPLKESKSYNQLKNAMPVSMLYTYFNNFLKQFPNNSQGAFKKVIRMYDPSSTDKQELVDRIRGGGYNINPMMASYNKLKKAQFGVEYLIKDLSTGKQLLRTRSRSHARDELEKFKSRGMNVDIIIASKKTAVSVDSKEEMYCPNCERKTMHETNWDRETPNQLLVICTECGESRTITASKKTSGIQEGNKVQFHLPDRGDIVGTIVRIRGDTVDIKGLDGKDYSVPRYFIDKIYKEVDKWSNKEKLMNKKKSYNQLKKTADIEDDIVEYVQNNAKFYEDLPPTHKDLYVVKYKDKRYKSEDTGELVDMILKDLKIGSKKTAVPENRIKELLEKLKDKPYPYKIIWMWIKQDAITLKEFKELKKIIGSKKTAQPVEDVPIPDDEEDIPEDAPEEGEEIPSDLGPGEEIPEEFPGEEKPEAPEIPEGPSIMNIITPMDAQLLSQLEHSRQKALSMGDMPTVDHVNTEIKRIIEKYTTPMPVGPMEAESFVARREQAHMALRRDMYPLLEKASVPLKKIQSLFHVSVGQVSIAGVHTDEYELIPKNGWVEWIVNLRKIGSNVPGKKAIIRVNIANDKAELLPVLWDVMGRRYALDEDGIKEFLGLEHEESIGKLEKEYLKEEQKIRKMIDKKELPPNVEGLGE